MCYPDRRISEVDLLDLLPSELESLAESLGAPRYRGRQIATWIYKKATTDVDAMSDLPRDVRARLAERAHVGVPEVERRTPSQDGSEKIVFAMRDGARVHPTSFAGRFAATGPLLQQWPLETL